MSADGGLDLARYMAEVARLLFGPPHAKLSTRTTWRYGNFGSLAIEIEKGVWNNHELQIGGGVLDLINWKLGLNGSGAAALQWMRDQGILPSDDRPSRLNGHAARRIVAVYDYLDENGEHAFRVVRFDPKDFRQCRRATEADDPARIDRDGWVWSITGVPQVPYRLPELQEAIGLDRTIVIVEGEKDVDNLWKRNIPATTNRGGAGKWPDDLNAYFRGADVVIVPDNDEAGRKHAAKVGAALNGVAARVRVLDLPGLGPKEDVSDWLAAGGTADEFYRLVEQTAAPPEVVRDTQRFPLIPFADLRPGTDPPYLIRGLIPRVGLIVAWGPPKCGKSFIAFDLAMHVALGREYRGRRVQGGPVVYCAFEGASGFHKRADAFRKQFLNGQSDPVPFYLMPAQVDLVADHEALIDAIRGQLGERRPVLVALDTLNRSLRGSENDDEDMSAYIRAADAIRAAFDCAVLVVHHCGIDGTRPRGHTSLGGAVDAQLAVKRDANGIITITLERLKDGPEGDTIAAKLEAVEIGIDEDGEPITSCVVVEATAITAASARVTGAAKVAFELLQRAIIDDPAPPPASNHIPPGSRTTTLVRWRAYCDAGTVASTDTPDTKRKAFVRAVTKLQSLEIIGVWNEYVWIAGHAGH